MKISERGQITIPQKFRERFGLRPFMEVEMIEENHRLVLRKKSRGKFPLDRFVGVLGEKGKSTDEILEELRGR